jgi:hypothetical protein
MFRVVFWVILPCKMIVDRRTNTDLTVIHADKGNATVVLDTMDYNEKI